jgi:hypothetical protein
MSTRHETDDSHFVVDTITMGIRSRPSITATSAAKLFLLQVLIFIVVREVRDCDGFVHVPVHTRGRWTHHQHNQGTFTQTPPSSSLLFLQPQQLGSFEPLAVSPAEIEKRRVLLQNWLTTSPIPIDFQDAWNVQKDLVQQHVDRLQRIDDDTQDDSSSLLSSFLTDDDDRTNGSTAHIHRGVDTVILLQHAPVYTLGTASDESFILDRQQQNDSNSNSIPTVRMDRGGEVTYHGPGHLTVYPILDLRH